MAETASTMLPLQTIAPDFRLLDVRTNTFRSLSELKSTTGTVIMFLCNHCPYVKYILPKLIEVAVAYQARGINFIAINSNDVASYPADNPDNMRMLAENDHFPFPYLYDETQHVARQYHAACTLSNNCGDAYLASAWRSFFRGSPSFDKAAAK